MATLFDCYDNAGGQSFTSSAAITVTLDTTREDEPSGSSPFSLASNVLTINESGLFVFNYRVSAAYASGTSTTLNGFGCYIEVDGGGGYSEIDGSRAWSYTAGATGASPTTATGHLAYTVTSGDKFRLRAIGNTTIPTWSTKADASGLTVWNDTGGGGGGSGETNTASNLGAGVGVFEQKSSVDLQFNSLVGANGVSVSEDDANDEIDIELNVNGLTAESTVDSANDYLVMYDASAGAHRKVLIDDVIQAAGYSQDKTRMLLHVAAVLAAVRGGAGTFRRAIESAAATSEADLTGASDDDAMSFLIEWTMKYPYDGPAVARAISLLRSDGAVDSGAFNVSPPS